MVDSDESSSESKKINAVGKSFNIEETITTPRMNSLSLKQSMKLSSQEIVNKVLVASGSETNSENNNSEVPISVSETNSEAAQKNSKRINASNELNAVENITDSPEEHKLTENEKVKIPSQGKAESEVQVLRTKLQTEKTILKNSTVVLSGNKEADLNTNKSEVKNVIQSYSDGHEKNNASKEGNEEFLGRNEMKNNPLKSDTNTVNEIKTSFNEIMDKSILRESNGEKLNSMNETMKTINQFELQDELKKVLTNLESKNVTLKLTPENLGKVQIQIDFNDNVMHTKISVESESVKQLIQSSLEVLKNSLSENGIQMASFSVNLSNNDEKGTSRHVIKTKKRNNHTDSNFSVESDLLEIKKKNLGYNTYDYIM